MRIALLLALAGCASAPPPLPPDLLARVDAELRALPPGARDHFFAEDLERLERLLESQRGTDEDRAFLEKRMLGEQIPRVYADLARVAKHAPKPRPPEDPVVVTFRDGRKLRGTIVESTATHLKIKARLGSITVLKADVLRVEPE